MVVSIEQLITWRAESLWDSVLDVIFHKVNRQDYHQYIETLQPKGLYQGELTLLIPEAEMKREIVERYHDVIVESLKKKSRVDKVLFCCEDDPFNMYDISRQECNHIIDPQVIENLWRQAMDRFSERENRQSYDFIQDLLTPLAKVEGALIVGIDDFFPADLAKILIHDRLFPCIQEVNSSIQTLEIVQMKKLKWREKSSPKSQLVDDREELWSQVLIRLSQQVLEPSFETWFKLTKLLSYQNGTATIMSPNRFTCDWLESRYRSLILDEIQKVIPSISQLKFVSSEEVTEQVDSSDISIKNRKEYRSLNERLDRIEHQIDNILTKLNS